jgi:ribosomal protein S10
MKERRHEAGVSWGHQKMTLCFLDHGEIDTSVPSKVDGERDNIYNVGPHNYPPKALQYRVTRAPSKAHFSPFFNESSIHK